MRAEILKHPGMLSGIDRAKVVVVLVFSGLIATAFLVSLAAMIYILIKQPGADIGLWLNIFLTCLGYVVGIVTGIFGIPAAPGGGQPQTQGRR